MDLHALSSTISRRSPALHYPFVTSTSWLAPTIQENPQFLQLSVFLRQRWGARRTGETHGSEANGSSTLSTSLRGARMALRPSLLSEQQHSARPRIELPRANSLVYPAIGRKAVKPATHKSWAITSACRIMSRIASMSGLGASNAMAAASSRMRASSIMTPP